MHDNLDDSKREQVKESVKIRKKEMLDNLDDDKRKQVKKVIKQERNKCVITLMIIKKGN